MGGCSTRVILAALMIHFHPTRVFSSIGQTEEKLMAATTSFLEVFNSIVSRIGNASSFCETPHDVTASLRPSTGAYIRLYEEWENPDKQRIKSRIVFALITLYSAKQNLPPCEPEDSKLQIELNSQIQRLKEKLKSLAGEQALRQFEESHGAGNAFRDYGIDEANVRGDADPVLSQMIPKEVLAHELLLDPMFQLTTDTNKDISRDNILRDGMERAFIDSMIHQLKATPPEFDGVLRILEYIRSSVLDLAPKNSPEGLLIQEAIDSSHIEQQLANGALNWNSCKQAVWSIFNVVLRICPNRYATMMKSWVEGVGEALRLAEPTELPHALCQALKFITECIAHARVDAANLR
jgi:hypothetical protein